MKIRWLLAVALAACLCAQGTLTNETILKLVKAGIGEDTIVGMVNQQQGRYSLSADDVIALKTAGVTDKILSAMIVKNGAGYAAAATTATVLAQPAVSSAPLVLHDATPIRLRLNRNLTSADAKAGDNVDFEVLDDLKIDDVLVIARGGTAIATITDAEHKKRMARGGKLDVNIDFVRLVNGDKVTIRAVKDVKGGGHTGAMTGAMVATSLVFFPAAPFFLFMHGKDVTIPKGTEITAYVDGEIKLERAKFVAGTPVQPSAQFLPQVAPASFSRANPPPPASTPVVMLPAPQAPAVIFPRPTRPSVPPADVPVVATPVLPGAIHEAPSAQSEAKPEPEAKLELTITSDPSGAAVEINGVVVGITPVTVALTPGTSCTLSLKKDGFVPWVIAHYPTSSAGKFSLNANLTREMFR